VLWGVLFSVGLVFGTVGTTIFDQHDVACDTGRVCWLWYQPCCMETAVKAFFDHHGGVEIS